jgi:transposase
MNYAEKITEPLDFLHKMRQNQKLTICRDRIDFLIYLKTFQAKTQAQAGEMIGLKERQSQNLWQIYRTSGFDGLIDISRKTYFGKLSSQQLSRLRNFLKTDQADSLESIQGWLLSQEQVNYTLGGISLLCKRLKIKLKTGRPTNIRKDVEGLEIFKKTFKILPKTMENQSIFKTK